MTLLSQNKPLYIAIEGIDGTGKTTQCFLLEEYLKYHGKDVKFVREPGGTNLGESIRTILSSTITDISDSAVLLMMYAARQQLHYEVITPSINNNISIISDRSSLSSWAYQYALSTGINKINFTDIKALELMLDNTRYMKPCTIVLRTNKPDDVGRIDNRGTVDMSSFDSKFSKTFLKIQKAMEEYVHETALLWEFIDIDNKSIEEVHKEIITALNNIY